jgi:hypothetical protein
MESKARQETTIGQGLALGVLAEGATAVTANKMSVDFAFSHAWRDWQHARRFPVVRASPVRNDILRIMRSSPRRQGPIVAAWDCEQWLRP